MKLQLFNQLSQNEILFARITHSLASNLGSLALNENILEISLIDIKSLIKTEGFEKVSAMMKANEIFVLNINKQNNTASMNFFSETASPIDKKSINKIKIDTQSHKESPESKDSHHENAELTIETKSLSKEEEEALLNAVRQIAKENVLTSSNTLTEAEHHHQGSSSSSEDRYRSSQATHSKKHNITSKDENKENEKEFNLYKQQRLKTEISTISQEKDATDRKHERELETRKMEHDKRIKEDIDRDNLNQDNLKHNRKKMEK